MTEPQELDAEVIADLARRAETAKTVKAYEIDGDAESVVVRVVRNDERVEVLDLERKLDTPRRPRGTANLYDPGDFVAYVKRLRSESTTVWGDEDKSRFTAVFNDHLDQLEPGWRDHTAVLQLQDDPEWTTWVKASGTWFGQGAFAEFLEDHAAAVVTPDGATMLEIATEFKAHKKAEFQSKVDLTTSDIQLTYNEETTAKTTRAGQLEIPREFVVSLAPFLGVTPRNLVARLKWNVQEGQLSIGYRLHRPDLVKRDAFADIRAALVEGLGSRDEGGVPVLLGASPAALNQQ
ncbi:DUF2303 family protein [Amycolatopsis sp. NPDC006131]|uniref:DUF2303 family protein n=1 Tax=Amycolatopsis sp. NPDC006131 TaxID=3156731 RepID=UPI0033B11CB3